MSLFTHFTRKRKKAGQRDEKSHRQATENAPLAQKKTRDDRRVSPHLHHCLQHRLHTGNAPNRRFRHRVVVRVSVVFRAFPFDAPRFVLLLIKSRESCRQFAVTKFFRLWFAFFCLFLCHHPTRSACFFLWGHLAKVVVFEEEKRFEHKRRVRSSSRRWFVFNERKERPRRRGLLLSFKNRSVFRSLSGIQKALSTARCLFSLLSFFLS